MTAYTIAEVQALMRRCNAFGIRYIDATRCEYMSDDDRAEVLAVFIDDRERMARTPRDAPQWWGN